MSAAGRRPCDTFECPGGAHSKTAASEQSANATDSHATPGTSALCPLDATLTIEDLHREVAAYRVDVERTAAESAALQAGYNALPDKASAKALALKAKLDASISSHLNKVKLLGDLEAQVAAQVKCIEESLAHVPLDTRSQFIVEVHLLTLHDFPGVCLTLAQARHLCQKDLRYCHPIDTFVKGFRAFLVFRYDVTVSVSLCRRNLRGILRPQKRRNKQRFDDAPGTESSDICFLCLADYHDELILLCDGEGCNNAAHMFCLTPPLLSVRRLYLRPLEMHMSTHMQVPSGNWLCPVCSQLDEVGRAHLPSSHPLCIRHAGFLRFPAQFAKCHTSLREQPVMKPWITARRRY